ncbi:MAG: short chain dehydrogenase [Microbacteriaceae bacterium]
MSKRVLLIGSAGTVGSAVLAAFTVRGYDLVIADYASPESPIDITDSASIARAYERAGEVDAVVSTVGALALAPLEELTLDQVRSSIAGKLLGQIDLVLQGLPHLRERGSFTLVSGIMSRIPWHGGVSAAIVNGGLDAFVLAAAAELSGGRRINSVSPSILRESIDKAGGENPLPGHRPIPASDVADAYVRSVEGIETGKTFAVGYPT